MRQNLFVQQHDVPVGPNRVTHGHDTSGTGSSLVPDAPSTACDHGSARDAAHGGDLAALRAVRDELAGGRGSVMPGQLEEPRDLRYRSGESTRGMPPRQRAEAMIMTAIAILVHNSGAELHQSAERDGFNSSSSIPC